MGKICRICKEEKELTDFHKKPDTKDGHRNECKECAKKLSKYYRSIPENKEKRKIYDKNRDPEKEKSRNKKYYDENKEIILKKKKEYNNRPDIIEMHKNWWIKYKDENNENIKKYHKNYRENNLEKIYEWRRKNPHIIAWRSLLYSTLKRFGTSKAGHTIDLLGYSANELKEHIEKLFTDGMSWDNYGDWHIDHIIPVREFTDDIPASIVCGLNNLQPLWATTRIINGIIYEGNLNKG